jgi:hypothetical protein
MIRDLHIDGGDVSFTIVSQRPHARLRQIEKRRQAVNSPASNRNHQMG